MIEFQETPEQKAALARVLAWWKSDTGWGKADAEIAEPVMTDGPGVFTESTVVTPSPASHGPRYHVRPDGKKSHHKEAPAPIRKCLDEACQELVGGNWERCFVHSKEWRRGAKARKRAASA